MPFDYNRSKRRHFQDWRRYNTKGPVAHFISTWREKIEPTPLQLANQLLTWCGTICCRSVLLSKVPRRLIFKVAEGDGRAAAPQKRVCSSRCQSGANCFSRTRHFLCQCRRMFEQRFLTRSIIQVRRSRAPSQTQDRRRLSGYMRRWLVERFFTWIQWQRPILVRWEYHAQNFLGLPRYPVQAILRPIPVTASKRNCHSQI